MSSATSKAMDPHFTARLRKRYAAERRFRATGLAAVVFSAMVLAFLIVTMTSNAIGGFKRTELRVTLDLAAAALPVDSSQLEAPNARETLKIAGLAEVIAMSATKSAGAVAASEIGDGAWSDVADRLIDNPDLLKGSVEVSIPVTNDLAAAFRGEGREELRPIAAQLAREGKLVSRFDPGFLTRSDATDPQAVGIWGALKGSMLTMLVTLALAFPVGVFAALYLEEYAPRSRWTDLIEVSINNLAAVPSIIFGLLGLAVFLAIFPNYRSAPLIGGMTLALMTMPVIVISGRNAIKAVPPSIRDGALAVGASRVQTVFHHVLPLALPGMLTGTIIGMARALGETAPLLMIGMRAFVATPPDGFTSPSSALPVQIFLWSDEVSRGFVERTSAAIIVLLVFLLAMNGLAIYLRNRFERRW
jgi:phosphate transport system permease protein